MSAFEEFGVMPELIRAVEDLDWAYALVVLFLFVFSRCIPNLQTMCCSRIRSIPTPIQAEAIPLILGGGDVLAVRCCPL
jgi:ATP-dependent RNA helicase DDX1